MKRARQSAGFGPLVATGLAAAVLIVSSPGCVPSSSAGAALDPRSTLRLATHTDVQSLDPAIAYDTTSWPLIRLLYQGLLQYGLGTDLTPWLAERMPDVSSDGRTFVFRIRPGVQFATGRELVAEDFIYTIERLLDPKTRSPGEGFFRNIVGARAYQAAREHVETSSTLFSPGRLRSRVAGLSAPDPRTLVIQLERPDLSFLNVMALPFAYVVDRHAVERAGDDFFRKPGGTGPFVLSRWDRGLRIQFARRPSPASEPGNLAAVELMVGAEDLVQQMMFERGELDLMTDIPPPDFARIVSEPRWKPAVTSMSQNATTYVSMNCQMPPFTDRRVRQALNHAVNRERILRIINGRGVVANGVLPPLMPGFNPQLRSYPYSPERARRLLREAGHPDGFDVTMWVIADRSQDVKIAQAVQQDLSEVGVKVALKNVAFASWNDAVGRQKTVSMAVSGWYQDYPDPGNFLEVLLSGYRIQPVACNNYAFYSNPHTDRLLRQAAHETDPSRRLRLYQEAEALIVADAPWVFLYHPTLYMLHQPRLRGFAMHPVWNYRLDNLDIE